MNKKYQVMGHWDSHPCLEGEPTERRNMRFKKELAFLNFSSHTGELALDAGCGVGFDTRNMLDAGINVVAVDFSIESLKKAKETSPEADFVQCDIENLPFRKDAFHFAISLGVLHHTPNTRKGIKQIRRVVKSDGHCSIMLYNKYYIDCLLARIRRKVPKHDVGCPIVKFYSEKEVRQLGINVFRAFGGRIRLWKFRFQLPDFLEQYLGFGIYCGW